MRLQLPWSLAAVLAGLLATPVLGQPMRVDVIDRLQQGMETPLLLTAPSVRKELKLTDEQGDKLRKIVKEAFDKYPREIRKATQEATDNVNKALPDILTPEQTKRLQQIKFQVGGVLPFTEPEVQQKLKLTDKQKGEMQTIADDLKKDIRKTIRDASNLRERVQAIGKVPQMRNEAMQKAVAVLSDEQKKTWNEMTGEKFEFPHEMLRSSIIP